MTRSPSEASARSRRAVSAAVAFAVTATAAGVGCSWIGDGKPASTTTSTSVVADVIPAPTVELLDPGEEPRRVLLFRFEEGDTATVQLTIDLRVEQLDGSAPQAIDPPAIAQTVRFDVDRVADGEAEVSFEVLDAVVATGDTALSTEAEEGLNDDLGRVVGLRGTGTVGDDGTFSRFAYDVPDSIDPSVAEVIARSEQQVAAMSVPLPGQPVGVGARWRTTRTVEVDGFRTDQVATYEISTIFGDSVTYTATVEHSSPAQELTREGLPDGTSATVVAATSRGGISGTLHLGSVLSPSDLILTGQQKVELASPSGTTTVNQSTDLLVTVRRAD